MSGSKTFCPIPWNHYATTPSGYLRFCCDSGPQSVLKDNSGKKLEINETEFSDFRNTNLLKEVRQNMLTGKWHPICEKKCKSMEDIGATSRRMLYNRREENQPLSKKAEELTATDGTIDPKDFPIQTVDLRFGNFCNLKCRMCVPSYSTKWHKDFEAITGKDYFYDLDEKVYFKSKHLYNYTWYKNPAFWDKFFKNSADMRYIYIIGGEPLLIKEHLTFLKKLVHLNLAKDIVIEYSTNLTYITDEMISLLKQFKKVIFAVSLDSVFKENDYIRNPSRFEDVVDNLKKIDEHSSTTFRTWITAAVQILNIYSLGKMLEWVLSQNFRFITETPNSPIVHFINVERLPHNCIQSLPKEVKKKAENKINEQITHLSKMENSIGIQKTIHQLEEVIKYMYLKDSSEHIHTFLDHTQKLDQLRNENFKQSFPELSKDLQQYAHNTSHLTL